GALELALASVGASSISFEPADAKHLRRGQAATVSLGEKPIGSIGRVSEEIAADYKFKQPVYVAEIDLQAVLETSTEPRLYEPLPKFPSIVRDVSFAVTRDISFGMIRDEAMQEKPE